MEPLTIGIIALVLMLIMIFFGFNIGLAFLFIGFFGFIAINGTDAAMGLLKSSLFKTASTYTFVTLPLFIMMGQLAFHSGMSKGLFEFASKWLGRLPGGLACGTVFGCACFGAICGSVNATAATMGTIALPEMRKRNYADSLTAGCIAGGGTLGILIPPSNGFIIYGMVAQVSIGKMFAAGILPGIILTVIMIIAIVLQVKLKPELAPFRDRSTWKEKGKSVIGFLPVFILFLIVFGGMFTGIFTVNEAGAVGCFIAFIYMIINRTLKWSVLKKVFFSTTKICAMVCLITMGANLLNGFFATSKLSSSLASAVVDSGLNKLLMLILITILWLFLGFFMDGAAITLLTIPMFMPILMAYNIDLIWIGVIHVVCSMVGCLTPPVGMSLFVLTGLDKKLNIQTVVKGSWPFLLSMVLLLIILFVFPDCCTVLSTLIA